MKIYTFRVTQEMKGYYQGEVSIEASTEQAARNKLAKLSKEELENLCGLWEQGDDADGVGDITIHEVTGED